MIKFTAPADRVIYSDTRVHDKVFDNLDIGERQVLELMVADPAYTFQEMADQRTGKLTEGGGSEAALCGKRENIIGQTLSRSDISPAHFNS